VSLKQRTVVALRTVKDVVNRYESVDKVPISRQLIREYLAAYSAYSTDLESTAQKATHMERAKREHEVADKEQQHFEQRKADVTQKQKEAEQLIAEASERLAKATMSDNKAELLAAQALLQSENTKLMEVRKAHLPDQICTSVYKPSYKSYIFTVVSHIFFCHVP